jgi:hypothetical protein
MGCSTRTRTPVGVAAVAFQVELALEGLVDRLDDLPQRPEQVGSGRLRLAHAGRAQQPHPLGDQFGLEPAAVVVLVGDQVWPGRAATGAGSAARMPTSTWRSSAVAPASAKPTGRPWEGADQVQPQPPEPAPVAGAVAVGGPASQRRPLGGLPGTPAFHRGGVGDPDIVSPERGLAGQRADDLPDEVGGGAQAFVVAGLLGQIREQAAEVGAGIAQPAGLRAEAEQGLQHRQGDQLGIAQLGRDPDRWPPGSQGAERPSAGRRGDVQCGGEGVQVGVHRASTGSTLGLQRRSWTPSSTFAAGPPGASNTQTPWNRSSSWRSRVHRGRPTRGDLRGICPARGFAPWGVPGHNAVGRPGASWLAWRRLVRPGSASCGGRDGATGRGEPGALSGAACRPP